MAYRDLHDDPTTNNYLEGEQANSGFCRHISFIPLRTPAWHSYLKRLFIGSTNSDRTAVGTLVHLRNATADRFNAEM